jgi:hypothetical protein
MCSLQRKLNNLKLEQEMKNTLKRTWPIFIIMFIFGLTACSEPDNTKQQKIASVDSTALVKLDVYKSPTCECCGRWINHIEQKGFDATTHHPADLNQIKNKLGVAAEYQSCHTGVSKDGYVFEGHIPADVMKRFLAEKPDNVLGLAVPGMPVGSPGMEMGDRHDDYDVLLLNKDGSSQVYARIRTKG